jgi:hypothetical protein
MEKQTILFEFDFELPIEDIRALKYYGFSYFDKKNKEREVSPHPSLFSSGNDGV